MSKQPKESRQYLGESKTELAVKTTQDLKRVVEKDAWIALRQYFSGLGNGSEAKVACVIIGTLAREEQAKNNARSLDILEKRLMLDRPQNGKPLEAHLELAMEK